MSNGSKWTPGKIFLVVIGVVVGLGLLCCGGIYAIWGPQIMSAVKFGTNSKGFVDALQHDYGTTAMFGIEKNDRMELILTIGVEGDLPPERVSQVQEDAWRKFGSIFATDGFFPVKYLAVGRPMGVEGDGGQGVIDWSKNMISVDELVKRTGVAAPPMVSFLPEEAFKKHGRIQVEVTPDGPEKEDEKSDEKEGGGGGADGK